MRKVIFLLVAAIVLSLPASAKFGKKALEPSAYTTAKYQSFEDVVTGQSYGRNAGGVYSVNDKQRQYRVVSGDKAYIVRAESGSNDPLYKVIPEKDITFRVDESKGEAWTTVMECCVGWRDKRQELHEVKYKIIRTERIQEQGAGLAQSEEKRPR